MGKRELVALLNLSSLCLVMVEWLFLAMPRGCLRFVSVVFPDHTHYFWYLSHCRATKIQAVLDRYADSPESSLLAYTKYRVDEGSYQNLEL